MVSNEALICNNIRTRDFSSTENNQCKHCSTTIETTWSIVPLLPSWYTCNLGWDREQTFLTPTSFRINVFYVSISSKHCIIHGECCKSRQWDTWGELWGKGEGLVPKCSDDQDPNSKIGCWGPGPDMFRHVRGGRLHFPDTLFLARKIMSSLSWLKILLYPHLQQLSFLPCTQSTKTHFIFSTWKRVGK